MSEKISINVGANSIGTVMFRGVDIAPNLTGLDICMRAGKATQITLYMDALDVQLDAEAVDMLLSRQTMFKDEPAIPMPSPARSDEVK